MFVRNIQAEFMFSWLLKQTIDSRFWHPSEEAFLMTFLGMYVQESLWLTDVYTTLS
jgi:hypothetical protein